MVHVHAPASFELLPVLVAHLTQASLKRLLHIVDIDVFSVWGFFLFV